MERILGECLLTDSLSATRDSSVSAGWIMSSNGALTACVTISRRTGYTPPSSLAATSSGPGGYHLYLKDIVRHIYGGCTPDTDSRSCGLVGFIVNAIPTQAHMPRQPSKLISKIFDSWPTV